MADVVRYAVAAETPVGPVWLAGSADGLLVIALDSDEAAFVRALRGRWNSAEIRRDDSALAAAVRQITDYLHGRRRDFDLALDLSDLTDFQRRALALVRAIPYGQTRTYGDLAAALGNPRAARAVGRANATNPLPLVIPCHRVLGSNNALHGYAYGLARKQWLLDLEGRHIPRQMGLFE